MSCDKVVFSDEESIDRERVIIDKQYLSHGFFCPICFCLLWKPRSCSTCENLFCQQCIQTWLKGNSMTCPLCRSVYDDKPVSPSILSHCFIHCRNASFGCTEILSYDCLEQHERVNCRFLTKKCRVCEQLILLTDIDQHRNECKSMVIKCPLCQYVIKTDLFENHREECLERYTDLDEESISSLTDMIASRVLSADFVGIELFNQSLRENYLVRVCAMVKLILSNRSLMHLIVLNILAWGCGNLLLTLITGFHLFRSRIRRSMYEAMIYILIFSFLFNYTLFWILQSFNDMFIIFSIIIGLIISSSINPHLCLNEFPSNMNLKDVFLFCFLLFLLLQLPLLLLRFYFDHISIPLGALCLSFTLYFQTI